MNFYLPEKGGTEFHVSAEDVTGWQRVYTNVIVESELAKMQQWLIANPKSQKTNTRRFITNWLARCEETKKPSPSASTYRAAVQAKSRAERALPAADPETARRALQESMALLGIRNGSG